MNNEYSILDKPRHIGRFTCSQLLALSGYLSLFCLLQRSGNFSPIPPFDISCWLPLREC